MHAYTHTGEPRHEVPTVSKNAKSKTRDTRISDMKEHGWVPSVSGITKVRANEAIERYMVEQAAKCAFRSPPRHGEDEKAYTERIIAAGKQEAEAAQRKGTIIHKALEDHYTGTPFDDFLIEIGGNMVSIKETIRPAIDSVGRMGIEIVASERVLVNAKYGYAGTTDIIWSCSMLLPNDVNGILDFKSTKTKPGKPVKPYQDHPLQISAYHVAAHGTINPYDRGYNVYISTTEPGRVEIKEWTSKELASAWEAFQHCLALWRYQTGYDPRTNN